MKNLISRFYTLVRKHLTPTLQRYLLVGGFGFLVDAGGMTALNDLAGVNVFIARACSMTFAIGCTYALHRFFTFTDSRKPARSGAQFVAFSAVQLAAAALNYGLFAVTIRVLPNPLPLLPAFIERDVVHLFALCLGTAAGLVFNYVLLRLVVFPAAKSPGGPKEERA